MHCTVTKQQNSCFHVYCEIFHLLCRCLKTDYAMANQYNMTVGYLIQLVEHLLQFHSRMKAALNNKIHVFMFIVKFFIFFQKCIETDCGVSDQTLRLVEKSVSVHLMMQSSSLTLSSGPKFRTTLKQQNTLVLMRNR